MNECPCGAKKDYILNIHTYILIYEGTLNALHHVKRALEGTGGARKIEDARILMIHSGGDSQRSPTNTVCGKAWSALNSISSQTTSEEHGSIVGCNTPIDVLLQQLCIFFHRIPSGCLVVGSSDVLLIVPSSATCSPIDWSQEHGVIGLACLAPLDLVSSFPGFGGL